MILPLRLYDSALREAVTRTGQRIVREMTQQLNEAIGMPEEVTPINVNDTITFTYTNWRGEVAEGRTARVLGFAYGKTPWHDEPQWLMLGFDLEKNAGRKYAMKDMSAIVKTPTETVKDMTVIAKDQSCPMSED